MRHKHDESVMLVAGKWVPRPTKKCPTCGGMATLWYDVPINCTELVPCSWRCKRIGHGIHIHTLTDLDKITIALTE